MPNLPEVIARNLDSQITGSLTVPARLPRMSAWPEWVDQSVITALSEMGVSRPWVHQIAAAELIHAGKHTVVATGTGSGKSLAAWIPVLSELSGFEKTGTSRLTSLRNIQRRPCTLYLSPTKALAVDQEHSLTTLANRIDPRLALTSLDGDSDAQTRTWARDYADIIFTNPDFVHHAILQRQELWARMWRGLSTIVVDEFHSYRGSFGSNVALVLRRVLRLARKYGSSPTVVFLSATSPHPEETAQRFIGTAFGSVYPVTEDGSPSGERHIFTVRCKEIPVEDDDAPEFRLMPEDALETESEDVLAVEFDAVPSVAHSAVRSGISNTAHDAATNETSSTAHDATPRKRRSANTEAADLTALLVSHSAQTLTFVRSRPGTERVAELANDYLDEHSPHLSGSVFAYRGGYLPEERRELEQGLRNGDIRALASTSALELGIDISGLDAVVVTGWPGTHASFQQQIGRAGRAGENGLAVFIGRDNPLDQFILDHPTMLTDTPAEMNVFDPTNPWILPGHLCSAAAESPLTEADLEVFSLPDTQAFASLVDQELLKRRPNGWYWNTSLRVSAHTLVDLRGEGTTVSIIDSESGALLGTVDNARADTTVYPGAIYLHQGVPFKVEGRDGDVALVHRHREEDIRTYPREETSVEIVDTYEEISLGIGTWCKGQVVVRSRVIGYDVRRTKDGMYLGLVDLSMPTHELITAGTWFTLNESALREAGVGTADLPGALHGAEHTMIALLPLFATCDRWDIGGLSTAVHPQTGCPTVIIHDAVAGGSGAAHRGFDKRGDWALATLDALENCSCLSGCPSCVQSPKCGNNNSPLSKDGAKILMNALFHALKQERRL
ncbi:DEAD/DEAH box helicase domain-containing protein [Arcanobacterium pluranimalium]|uniref:DEAD/DEAH box helicase n=1 Tax=Arcanobacterium pluranimalium TaxID=108028 RepID=UPI001956A7D0|nr:DEAD/DEAH box helicase [Arcanobacterium pluranimalium]MBM7824515.1 DEAD/DEAH box helicase domain-containing protein [Arcanobacterium pluranimalium]